MILSALGTLMTMRGRTGSTDRAGAGSAPQDSTNILVSHPVLRGPPVDDQLLHPQPRPLDDRGGAVDGGCAWAGWRGWHMAGRQARRQVRGAPPHRLRHAAAVLRDVPGISVNYFNEKDVVRHEIVGEIIKAYEKYETADDRN